jgi:glycosyltransferase involved in cell wall biosynthesis
MVTFNDEANLPRTLESVKWADEIIVVDAGSTDRTVEIARSFNAKAFVEQWKGFASQTNSGLEKATCDWVLSIRAGEVVPKDLRGQIETALFGSNKPGSPDGYSISRMNYILGRWMRHGGYWPDHSLRLFRRGVGRAIDADSGETIQVNGKVAFLREPLFHEPYSTLAAFIDHMERYSSLDTANSAGRFSIIDLVIRPFFSFVYTYIFRRGFLDGREGLLLHLYNSVFPSWKHAKAWEMHKKPQE